MADRTVHIRLYADLVIKADDDVEISQFLQEATLDLHSDMITESNRVDLLSLDIMHHEVTDSK